MMILFPLQQNLQKEMLHREGLILLNICVRNLLIIIIQMLLLIELTVIESKDVMKEKGIRSKLNVITLKKIKIW